MRKELLGEVKASKDDFATILWVCLLSQLFSAGFIGSDSSMWNSYGFPFPFYWEHLNLEEGVPRNWVFEPGFNVWLFLLNTFVIIVFATIYIAVTKSLFRIFKLGAFKITNTTAALLIVAINLFFSFRSRAMAFPFPDQIEYPLKNFQYGIPIADSKPDPDFGAITNYPVAVLGNTLFALGLSTISALCVAMWKQRQSRRITTRGTQAQTATR